MVSAVALAACTGSDPELGDLDSTVEPASETLAVAALTWRSGEPTGTGLAQVYVIDHPLGQRAAALELMLLPNAVLALDTSIGVGECRVDRPRADPGTIVLRDAGEVAVEADMGVTVLDSSWLPEGSLDISGVAYAGFVPPKSRSQRTPIQVFADGSPDVGPFSVQLIPPPAVRILAVNHHEVARGRFHVEGARANDRPWVDLDSDELAQHLDITWQAPTNPATAGDALSSAASSDLTVVVFERRSFGATWTISCVAEDDGRFTIPAGALLSLPDLGSDRTDSVMVRRISSASFSARHVPEGMALAVSEDQVYVE